MIISGIDTGELDWGELINTTGNRIQNPKGQFNRDDGPLPDMSVDKIFELEQAVSRKQNIFLTVTIKELLKCAEFKGDIDQIAKHLCEADWEEHLVDDPTPKTTNRASRASGSPVKDGEDVRDKRLEAERQRQKAKLYGMYTTWTNQVKAWLKSTKPSTNPVSKSGKTESKTGPWDKIRAAMAALETENKRLKAENRLLKKGADSQSTNASDDTLNVTLQAEARVYKKKYEEVTETRKNLEKEVDNITTELACAKVELESIKRTHTREMSHSTELAKQKEAMADMAGYIRGIKEGPMSGDHSNNTPMSSAISLVNS